MKVSRRSINRVVMVFVLALSGAGLMISVDRGGTVWLKFVLYAIFFFAIFFAAVFSPASSCSWSPFRRQPKS
jgi:hypothetical protein